MFIHDQSDSSDYEDEPEVMPQKSSRLTPATHTDSSVKLVCGDFVTAVCQNECFIAQIESITEDEERAFFYSCTLSYMKRVGINQFVWPESQDLLLTCIEDILAKVKSPVLANSRDDLGLDASDLCCTQKIFHE